MRHTHSAGGVVINESGQVLVTNQRGDSWSLPKGHIDSGEDARTAAAREIEEETGVKQLKFIKELGSYQRHQIGKGGIGENLSELKTITLFLYATNEIKLQPTDQHHPEAKWVELEDVENLLTHPKDRAFFQKVSDKVREVIARKS